MSARDYYAAHAPIDFDTAQRAWKGYVDIGAPSALTAFLEFWAYLRFAYADAMLAEIKRRS